MYEPKGAIPSAIVLSEILVHLLNLRSSPFSSIFNQLIHALKKKKRTV
jgi:hypothetical protein